MVTEPPDMIASPRKVLMNSATMKDSD